MCEREREREREQFAWMDLDNTLTTERLAVRRTGIQSQRPRCWINYMCAIITCMGRRPIIVYVDPILEGVAIINNNRIL